MNCVREIEHRMNFVRSDHDTIHHDPVGESHSINLLRRDFDILHRRQVDLQHDLDRLTSSTYGVRNEQHVSIEDLRKRFDEFSARFLRHPGVPIAWSASPVRPQTFVHPISPQVEQCARFDMARSDMARSDFGVCSIVCSGCAF